MEEPKAIRVAAGILGAITFFEGIFVIPPLLEKPHKFLVHLGFLAGPHLPTALGWALGFAVALAFIAFSCRLPSVRANLFRPSWLKLIAIGLAVVAGILEEYYFRGIIMDWAMQKGSDAAAQVVLSGLAFGVAHGIWALFRGSLSTGVGAIIVTGVLGALLAIVYLASNRSLAPCITSHFLINLFIEPGLVLAAVRGEMRRRWRPGSAQSPAQP